MPKSISLSLTRTNRATFTIAVAFLCSATIVAVLGAQKQDVSMSAAIRLGYVVIRTPMEIIHASSRNVVSLSSARETKRFPSSRCASAIQMVRP